MARKSRKNKAGKGNKSNLQTLAYPLAIRNHARQKQIVDTLLMLGKLANEYLVHAYNRDTMELLASSSKKAYKVLEPLLKGKVEKKIASRINRGVLEVVGRQLRSINERRQLFDILKSLDENPKKWNYRKLIRERSIYVKSMYVKNLAEQTQNYIDEHEKIPGDFFELQPEAPQLKHPVITYAPDDGQAIIIRREKNSLKISMKIAEEEEDGQVKWSWIDIEFNLPPLIEKRPHVAPDLRLACIHGRWLPVLDYKTEVECQPRRETRRFLAIDWGIRKIVTLAVFDKNGDQLTPPIFLKCEPILKKLLRIRNEIDKLKSKLGKLDKQDPKRREYQREIARRWRKFRAINQALSHLVANTIVLIARLYGCSEIYVEWLKGLKRRGANKDLNWVVNTTVRQAIFDRVEYKAKRAGIKMGKPIPPGETSQRCPRCGEKGEHVHAPDQKHRKYKEAGWFYCPHCKFQADRDYVGVLNIARKVLYGFSLRESKPVVYMKAGIPAPLFRQGFSSLRIQLLRNLRGWLRQPRGRQRDLYGWQRTNFLRPKYLIGVLKNKKE